MRHTALAALSIILALTLYLPTNAEINWLDWQKEAQSLKEKKDYHCPRQGSLAKFETCSATFDSAVNLMMQIEETYKVLSKEATLRNADEYFRVSQRLEGQVKGLENLTKKIMDEFVVP